MVTSHNMLTFVLFIYADGYLPVVLCFF